MCSAVWTDIFINSKKRQFWWRNKISKPVHPYRNQFNYSTHCKALAQRGVFFPPHFGIVQTWAKAWSPTCIKRNCQLFYIMLRFHLTLSCSFIGSLEMTMKKEVVMETGLGASRLSKSGWVLDQHVKLCCPEGQEVFVSQDLTQVSGVTKDACRAQRTGQKNH